MLEYCLKTGEFPLHVQNSAWAEFVMGCIMLQYWLTSKPTHCIHNTCSAKNMNKMWIMHITYKLRDSIFALKDRPGRLTTIWASEGWLWELTAYLRGRAVVAGVCRCIALCAGGWGHLGHPLAWDCRTLGHSVLADDIFLPWGTGAHLKFFLKCYCLPVSCIVVFLQQM